VVIVNGAALTPEEFERLLTIDTVMAGLAGHAPSAPGLVLEQWINGELAHRQAMQAASAPVDGADSLAAFLARTGRDRAELDAALAAAQVPQAAFDAYWQRLILADQFVRAAAAAQGIAAGDVVRALQEGARISFGTAASALFATPVTATPVAAGGTDLTAAAPVASGASTAADRATDAATSNVAISDAASAAVRGVETGMLAPEFVLGALNTVAPTLSLAESAGKTRRVGVLDDLVSLLPASDPGDGGGVSACGRGRHPVCRHRRAGRSQHGGNLSGATSDRISDLT
jgi:hypothetical protein